MVTAAKRAKSAAPRNSRQAILKAAMHLFAEHGFEGTSLRDIAKAARISLGLVTQFYGTKAALHEAVDDYVLTEFSEFVASFSDEQNFFEKSYKASVEFISQHRNQYCYIRRALVEESPGSTEFFKRYHAMQVNVVRRAKRSGAVAEDVDETLAALILIFLVLGPFFCMHQVEAILGTSVFDSKAVMRRNTVYARLLQRGFGINS